MPSDQPHPQLKRELSTSGAVFLGMGAMVGTGIFVSSAIATGVAGVGVIPAVLLASVLAAVNGLNSAQLAASHPVSGGAYEYGYQYATPLVGFIAGWLFLLAKSASAATAALGCAAYLGTFGVSSEESTVVPLALLLVGVVTLLVITGVRRSNLVNIVIVIVTLLALAAFVFATAMPAARSLPDQFASYFRDATEHPAFALRNCFYATALMFVAYTGYGRVATLGEEVRHPRRTIPRAIMITVSATALVYLLVITAAVGAVGTEAFSRAQLKQIAPLVEAARSFDAHVATVVAVGATVALLGVLLNLLLGLSRVVLAMGRRGDLPAGLAVLDRTRTAPRAAVVLVGVLVGGLVLIGDVGLTWSFSAFTVLGYYAINNYCALRIPEEKRLYPRALAWVGLAVCLFLAFWVELRVWLSGCGLVVLGAVWHVVARRLRSR